MRYPNSAQPTQSDLCSISARLATYHGYNVPPHRLLISRSWPAASHNRLMCPKSMATNAPHGYSVIRSDRRPPRIFSSIQQGEATRSSPTLADQSNPNYSQQQQSPQMWRGKGVRHLTVGGHLETLEPYRPRQKKMCNSGRKYSIKYKLGFEYFAA